MLLVIADTSPIRYLIQIGHVELLHSLFENVSIPTEVCRELSDPSAPRAVQAWISAPPAWLSVRSGPMIQDPALEALDPGERSAIALGISLQADLILIDERKGKTVAASKGLVTAGTLGILDLAAKRKLINIQEAVDQLKQTNFRYRKEVIHKLLEQHGIKTI